MSHKKGHDDYDLIDVIKVTSRILDWKNDKTDEKAQDAWNHYNRQVDIWALDGLKSKLARRDAILSRQIETGWRRHSLLERRADLVRSAASLRRTLERERMVDAERESRWRAREARAELGVETERANEMGLRIASGYDQLAADKLALSRTYGANTEAIIRQLSALEVERGVFTEEQADKLQVLSRMAEAVEVNAQGTGATFEARQQALVARMGQFEVEWEVLGRDEAIQRAELREQAAFDVGSAVASGAARFGTGSFAITEAQRIGRRQARAEQRLVGQTSVTRSRIEAGIAGVRSEAAGLLAGFRSAQAQTEVQRAEVGADIRGTGRAGIRFGVGQATERARLGAALAGEEARLGTGQAELRGRERGLGAEQAVLLARRHQLSVAAGSVTAAEERGVRAARRIGAEAETDYANAQAEAAGLLLAREDVRTDIDKLVSEQLDSRHEKKIADWQRENIEDLPMKGSSRGALGLLLQVAADVVE